MEEIICLMQIQSEQLKTEFKQAQSFNYVNADLKEKVITDLSAKIIKNEIELALLRNMEVVNK